MKNLTKSFKTLFVAYIVLFLFGVLVSCIFGLNTSSPAKRQRLVYEVSAEKDNYDAEIDLVKDYLKDNGAGIVSVEKTYDAFNKVHSLIFNFKTKTALESQVTISGNLCQVYNVDNTQAKRTVGMAAIALGVALVILFVYLVIRFIKNNPLAHSLTVVCTVVLNWLAIFGIVQLVGFLGYQFDTTVMAAFAYAILFTAVTYLVTVGIGQYLAENKKVSFAEGMVYANKLLKSYYLVFSILVLVVCVVLSVTPGGAFAIKMIPIAIAAVVCLLSTLVMIPAFRALFAPTTEESTKTVK